MNRFNLLILVILGLTTILSCSKTSNHTADVMGKWSVINDSTRFIGRDTFPSYHYNYVGQPSDYYDFRSNGMMYVKEGGLLDTMAYEVLSSGQVRCSPSPGLVTSYTTSQVTDSTANFSVQASTPQGDLTKLIYLRK